MCAARSGRAPEHLGDILAISGPDPDERTGTAQATGTSLPFLTMFVDAGAFPGAATLNPLEYNVGCL